MTLLYWRIGRRIQSDVLRNERAEYGKEIVSMLSRQLVKDFGSGFSVQNLRHMMRFSESFSELAQLRADDKLSPDLVFRDPYILDFLGLKDCYPE